MALPTCVITNPAAGRGKARRQLESARRRFGPEIEYRPTAGPGHAVELARTAAVEGFARVVAAGGDGTVHEVANGLLTSGRSEVILSVWPLGSMNDFAYSLGLLRWWAEGAVRPLDVLRADVGAVRADGRERYFVNGCGVGFNGLVAHESRSIRSLRGLPLYVLAFLKSMVRHFATPAMSIQLDSATSVGPTLSLSLNLGQREGGFPVSPAARLDDGAFDVLHVGAVRRWELLRYLPGLIAGRLPTDHPHIRRGRCGRAIIRAAVPLCVHIDGELFAVPGDGVRELEVELLPNRLRVEVCPPYLYGG
ncbi:MAG TPA: diacylglycerol kinase family protein [Fimbriiglobus sp.]|nr:diacylglycerol kinase family protein [Fimbriiglobus sp.]